MVSRVLILQGAIAWLSVCFLLMVIWHQRHLEESPVQHDASLLKSMSLAKVKPLLVTSPSHANSIEDTVPPVVADPPKSEPTVPAAAAHTPQKSTYRRHPQPIAEPQTPIKSVTDKKIPTPSKLPEAVPAKSKEKGATADKGKKKKENKAAADDASSSSDASVDSAPVPVYMDWGRGNLAFTLANYRSLESVLAHHPKAEVRVQTVAPVSASMYRYANTLSWTQFKKYFKRGYDVQIELVSSLTSVYVAAYDRFNRPKMNLISENSLWSSANKKPGSSYWDAIKKKCCEAPSGFNDQRKVEDSRLLPAHLNFMRLVRLWGGGGVYLGFSFLLDAPLPHGQRILDLGPQWTEPEIVHQKNLDEAETSSSSSEGGSSSGVATTTSSASHAPTALLDAQPACSNEMLLQFPEGHDPLLGCALGKYDTYFSSSGDALNEADSPCRDLAHTPSSSSKGEEDQEGKAWEHHYVATLRHLHNRPVPSGPSMATNKPAKGVSWYLGYDGVDTAYEAKAITAQICLRRLFRTCLAEEEALRAKSPKEAPKQIPRTSVIEWHQCDMETLHERFHGEDHPHAHVFAKPDASDQTLSSSSSPVHEEDIPPPLPHKGLSLAESLSEDRRPYTGEAAPIDKEEDAQHDDSAGSSSYSSKRSGSAHVVGFWIGPPALDGVWKEPASGTALDREFTRSHAALTQWGVVGKAGASCMQPRNCSAFDTTGNWKENALDLQAAKFRCAPSFVIPGTQKGASTFLFHALSRHPQVVPPLRGAHGYKEAGAYVLQNCRRKHNQIGNRVHRFPFLEPDEPFATGDGTVHYMISCPAIPGELVRDNPSVRVIFALRDPIARMWSDYRFAAQWYKQKGWGFNEVVAGTLPHYAKCFLGYVNGSLQRYTQRHASNEFFLPVTSWMPHLKEGDPALKVEQSLDDGSKAFYTKRCDTKVGDNHNLIKKSLYVFQVRHWLSLLGHDRMRVVTTEDIIKDQTTVLQETLAFVGLCPFKFGNLGKDNVTPFDVRGSYRINEESFNQLKAFFEPFNKALYSAIGRDLGWETATFNKYKK